MNIQTILQSDCCQFIVPPRHWRVPYSPIPLPRPGKPFLKCWFCNDCCQRIPGCLCLGVFLLLRGPEHFRFRWFFSVTKTMNKMWLLKYACGGSAVFWVRFSLGAAMDPSWWGRSSASPILWTLSTLHQSSRCSSRRCPQGGSTSSCPTLFTGPSLWVVEESGRCPRACVSLSLPSSSTASPPPDHLSQTPSPAKVLCRGSWVSVVGATVSKLAVIRDRSPGSPGALRLLELFQARLSTLAAWGSA